MSARGEAERAHRRGRLVRSVPPCGAALTISERFWQELMIWLGIGIGYMVLAVVITFLVWRLFKLDAELFNARRQAAHAQVKQEGAQQRARAAEERCRAAIKQAETSLTQTGQALEVMGHIKLVSQQVAALIAYITDPEEAPPAFQQKRGRHALPAVQALPNGDGRHAITGHMKEFIP